MPHTPFHMAQSCRALRLSPKPCSIFQLMFWLHLSTFKHQLPVSWLGRFPPVGLLVVWLTAPQDVQTAWEACRRLGDDVLIACTRAAMLQAQQWQADTFPALTVNCLQHPTCCSFLFICASTVATDMGNISCANWFGD